MKVEYIKPRGQRMKNQFTGLADWNTIDESYYYSYKKKKFVKWEELDNEVYSNQCDCGSIRMAIRILKKSNLPKGLIFKLWHKYRGYEVYITT